MVYHRIPALQASRAALDVHRGLRGVGDVTTTAGTAAATPALPPGSPWRRRTAAVTAAVVHRRRHSSNDTLDQTHTATTTSVTARTATTVEDLALQLQQLQHQHLQRPTSIGLLQTTTGPSSQAYTAHHPHYHHHITTTTSAAAEGVCDGQDPSKIQLQWDDLFNVVCLGCSSEPLNLPPPPPTPAEQTLRFYYLRKEAKAAEMAGGPPVVPNVLPLGVLDDVDVEEELRMDSNDVSIGEGSSMANSPSLAQMDFSSPCGLSTPDSSASKSPSPSPSSFGPRPITPEGMDCHGNERQALVNLGRFFSCPTLSDVRLKVGGKLYHSHKLVLVNGSDVFERMFASEWQDSKQQEVELHEDAGCIRVFPHFLRYLYTYNIVLNADNVLPVLVLADKYNVISLRQVCVHFACSHVIPRVQLKEVFHVWFQYATRGQHRPLITACVNALAVAIEDVAYSAEWENEWLGLDQEQLIELLRSSDLVIRDEYELWGAVHKWLTTPMYPKRASQREQLLRAILPYVRFPMMTPEQLSALEETVVVLENLALFAPHLLRAYKYHSLPLAARLTARDFATTCLLRNYTATRWDKRLVVGNLDSVQKCTEVSLRFTTRASSFPAQTWEWELKLYPKGFSSSGDDLRCMLYSNLLLDQPRPVEFLLSIVDDAKVLCSVTGKKNFSKNRYTTDTELDKKVTVAALNEIDSPYIRDGRLVLQILLRPVE